MGERLRVWRLRLHKTLHPEHLPIGQYGTPDACGTCSGFAPREWEAGAVSHHVPPWWRVTARRKYPRGYGLGRGDETAPGGGRGGEG